MPSVEVTGKLTPQVIILADRNLTECLLASISVLSACFALRSVASMFHVAGAVVEILRICAKEWRIAAVN